MQDREDYRCIEAACGRTMPRAVRFCPYCGTPQQGGAARPVGAPSSAPVAQADAGRAAPVQAQATLAPLAAALTAQPERAPAPDGVHHLRDADADADTDVASAAASVSSRAANFAPAAPPQRRPVHWFWWLCGLGLLWLAWVAARPEARKFDRRVDQAVALAAACKSRDAQSELIALRAARAPAAQLQRLQTALNDNATVCEHQRQRAKAWTEASGAIDTALASAALERARSRLAAFTRRWGEDGETVAAKARIDAARREAPVAAAPPAEPAQSRQSARNLVAEAERDLARGNYRGAIDKMETCISMVDAGNGDCAALKARAERLYQGL